MELLQGRPLDAVLAETGATGLGFEASRALVDEISSGLAFAHGRGVIHCDLKPANVFVLDSGAVKILDFGLAIASRGGRFEPGLLDGYTLAYASPEMLQEQDRHPSDDVYALGCLVYAMVSGRRPFGTRSALEARDEKLKVERPNRMPGPAWKGLRKSLSLSRDERLPDAASFRSAYFEPGWRGFFRR
jgi:eukaryotic-like serine/threonine-protein kinase